MSTKKNNSEAFSTNEKKAIAQGKFHLQAIRKAWAGNRPSFFKCTYVKGVKWIYQSFTCGENALISSLGSFMTSAQTVLTLESQCIEGTFTFCSADTTVRILKRSNKMEKPCLNLPIHTFNLFLFAFIG